MAPVYADHPFTFIPTPTAQLKDGQKEDQFDQCATEMALVHNMLIRGLNSIYLQAPHIQPKDEASFLNYILAWYAILHTHHEGEEADFFPTVEKMSGAEGIMATNVEQHHAFQPGLEALVAYAKSALAKTEKYDGARIVSLIDAFGHVLAQHLADEIPTLLSLRQYGDKMASLKKRFDEEGEKNMKAIGMFYGLCCGFANLDVEFEGGIHKFPPAPAPIKWFICNVAYRVHADWWKFGATDFKGRMRPLYAVPADATNGTAAA